MNISLHSKGIDLLPEEKEYAHALAEKLMHRSKALHADESIRIKIEIDKQSIKIPSQQFWSIFTIEIQKHTIRAEAHGSGIYSSLDDAFSTADKQLHEQKSKKIHDAKQKKEIINDASIPIIKE